ncbi:MAG: sigma-70 family RNA polymerase sigma factor [Ignavibacteriales bacterium]|nr:MAG: sigma-70 family RNA polymerase sigma factor [Ignavibacteriales bacterium]
MQNSQIHITKLLNDYSNGNKLVLAEILPLVYNELRRISSKYLREEHRNHTLQTTELVHEAYLKLIGDENISWESRAHFFGIAAQSMRQILVDHARKRNSKKRGDGEQKISLDDSPTLLVESDEQIIALDDALKKLEAIDSRSGKIVEMRFFSGLSIEETAKALNISTSTAKRDWNFAKAWLYREIG